MSEKPYEIEALELGPMENFIYLITDKATQRTAVVDPAWDVPSIIEAVNKKQRTITDVLLTHSHHDHINGIDELLQSFDAEIHLCHAEARFWGQSAIKVSAHHGGEQINLGKTDIQLLHTPGHTPGSACYHLGNDLITGDTMFVYGCGRCDLAGGDPNEMYHTLKHMSETLPDETCILPGHNYAIKAQSTIADEKSGNPFLHQQSEAKFVEYRMKIHDSVRDVPYHPQFK